MQNMTSVERPHFVLTADISFHRPFSSNSSAFFPLTLATSAAFPLLWPEAQDFLLATSAAISAGSLW